jgi:hypothetical protein
MPSAGTSIAMNSGSECVIALPPQPTAANTRPAVSVRRSPRRHHRADESHLHEDAEEAERRQQIPGVRRRAETPRAEQRKRRPIHGEDPQ